MDWSTQQKKMHTGKSTGGTLKQRQNIVFNKVLHSDECNNKGVNDRSNPIFGFSFFTRCTDVSGVFHTPNCYQFDKREAPWQKTKSIYGFLNFDYLGIFILVFANNGLPRLL